MLYLVIALAACNVIQVILYFLTKKKIHNVYGTIIMHDTNSMYVELDDYDSIHKIYSDDYASFRVKKTH